MKKGYKKLLKLWYPSEIAEILNIKQKAVYPWKTRGVPRKYWQALCEASNGKIKTPSALRG